MRRLARAWTVIAATSALLASAYDWRPIGTPEHFFLWRQDLPVLLGATLALWLAAFTGGRHGRPAAVERGGSRLAVWVAAAAVLAVGVAGAGLVFEHYNLSLDEFLADFDAAILRRGLMMAPLPEPWRPFAQALQPIYMLETPGHALWASSYLPVNAMFRAAAGAVHLTDWLNPLFSAIGVIATFGVGLQLWPDRPRRAVFAALLTASSAQIVVTAMSAYAMPGHLALNMVWLWLFLRRRAVSDVGAIAVGFIAASLHQLLFHPLFAGFFVLDLWLTKRWRRAAVFTLAYAAIGLFWIAYWALLYKGIGIPPAQAEAVGGGWFVERILTQLRKVDAANLFLMAESLVRFISWQNIVVPGLALIGGVAVWRKPGPLRAMGLAILATVMAMLILVPTQTHGWGYRYLHGLIGAASLLAVEGWTRLTAGLEAPETVRANRALALLALASAVVLIPVRAWQARSFSHPYAVAEAAIRHSGADIVLIDNGLVGFDAGSFVRNDPFLERSPKVLLLGMLAPAQLDQLCARGKVWVFDAKAPSAAGILTFEAPWAGDVGKLRAHLRQIGCAG
jgi:hypothetical protein